MAKIALLHASEILDSRGSPTLEVVCMLESGAKSVASVPSGKSVGAHEAFELRDGDVKRYGGLGVLRAVENVNAEIFRAVSGKELDQKSLDELLIALDGTDNKSRLGANAILAVSLSFARATAIEKNIELYEYLGSLIGSTNFTLPEPAFNVINGGKHSDSGLDIQEFLIIPVGISGFRKKVEVCDAVIVALRNALSIRGYAISVGDEGGFAPKLSGNEEAFSFIETAIKNSGYSTQDVKIGIDVASTSFYENGKYNLKVKGKSVVFNSEAIIKWYEELISSHPIISIEDGLAEDDWDGFSNMKRSMGDKILIVGDDLLTTNVLRIRKAIEHNAVNSVLIKLNQIGTLTETIQAIELTKKYGWKPFISHRSGETTDTFISDLAVGLFCPFIKSGSLTRAERVAKYNRLMEIADILEK